MDATAFPPSFLAAGKAAARRVYARAMQRPLIDAYLAAHKVVKICIGAGGSRRDGWLSTDYDPPARDIVFLDATRRFPLPTASVDYFVAEHMIEHVPLADGLYMLTECFRALKPGGKVRIATPDITRYRSFLTDAANGDARTYIRWSNETFGGEIEKTFPDSGVVTFNRVVRAWGHQFIYDPPTLSAILASAGFVNITPRAVGESDDPHLRNIELRAGGAYDFANTFETMIFEAQKPAS
jgi:predicted SAM-dependent methyltransferase